MFKASDRSHRTHNPIRHIVDNLKPPTDHPAKLLNLALGDPTAHRNIFCPQVLVEAVKEQLTNFTANGYLPSVGLSAARKAIAEYSSRDGFPVKEDDVIIASGGSGAIELVLSGLLNEGDNILVPAPGFPLYEVIANSLGGHVKKYALLPETSWSCDVAMMDSLVDERTRAIVINNPSNPCGSNFTVEHLKEICAVARKHNLLIISDEIYSGLAYAGDFAPCNVHSGDVPVISIGGIAKEFIVPGWRVGWLVFHDKGTGRFAELSTGIRSLTQVLLGANSLIQAALPRVLTPAVDSQDAKDLTEYNAKYRALLQDNAKMIVKVLTDSPALQVVEPHGAMYAMLGLNLEFFDAAVIPDDAAFARLLLQEENLFLLPGQCFSMKNFVRLVICCPTDAMTDACNRIKAFCARHAKN